MHMQRTLTQHFEEYDRRIFWTVCWCTAFTIFLYIYFLGTSVYSVIARKQAEVNVANLTSRISQLESEYVLLDKKINLDLAHTKGYIDVAVPRYVSRATSHDTFTLREVLLR